MLIGFILTLVLLFLFIVFCFIKHFRLIRSQRLNSDRVRSRRN